MSQDSPRFGIIGLGVMGRSLALNLASQSIPLAAYSLSDDERSRLHDEAPAVVVSDALEGFVESIATPRTILLMITAGDPVDQVLEALLPMLQQGDVVLDGGNSRYQDTERRVARCADVNVTFMGVGISGGEEGARHGASVMVGGSRDGFEQAELLFGAIACDFQGEPCYGWVGAGGAGHLVKTVHNGIEYGVMQLIAEVYDLLRRAEGRSLEGVQQWFERQRTSPLESYLIDITADILAKPDDLGEGPLIDKVADRAGQKGTGVWSVQAALEFGVPVPSIIAAVTERQISAQDRVERKGETSTGLSEGEALHDEDVAAALLACMIATFVQGLSLIAAASRAHAWETDVATAVRLWRDGCIIRAALLAELLSALETTSPDAALMRAANLERLLDRGLPGLRRLVSLGVGTGVSAPALSASLAYLDSMSSPRLPTHLVQAQRDYFGAHTFERTDRPGKFHVDWD